MLEGWDVFLVLVSHCLAVADKRAYATSLEINGTFSPGICGQWGTVMGGSSLAEALYSSCSWADKDPCVGTLQYMLEGISC